MVAVNPKLREYDNAVGADAVAEEQPACVSTCANGLFADRGEGVALR